MKIGPESNRGPVIKQSRTSNGNMSDAHRNTRLDDEGLDWLAFRYASGELTGSEQAAFEERLNPDSESFSLAACEAVAGAVQLCDVVVAAFDGATESRVKSVEKSAISLSPRNSPSRKLSRRRDVFARRASIAATLAAVVAVGWMLSDSDGGRTIEVVDVEGPSMVAADQEAASEIVQFWVDSDSEFALGGDERLLTPVDVSGTRSADVPDWLLAAVQSQQRTGDALSEPEVLEN
jgi:hypothetical protein